MIRQMRLTVGSTQFVTANSAKPKNAVIRPDARSSCFLTKRSFRMPASRGHLLRSRAEGTNGSIPFGADLPPMYAEPEDRPPKHRRAGIILHPTSLPGNYGIGEIGMECIKFLEWMGSAGMGVWQVLPLVPPDLYGSPYSSTDALCGNTLLIAIDDLVNEGLLDESDKPPVVPIGDVDFLKVAEVKEPLVNKAADRLVSASNFGYQRKLLEEFRKTNAWIEDSALFAVLSAQPENLEKPWWEWEEPLRLRDPDTLAQVREKFATEITRFIVKQFLFDRQWKVVKDYANLKDILVVGDMPIYVGGHSADVWANRHLFELSENGEPELVSGVPPDAFSETGQLWGSPLYDWNAHKKQNYEWWVQRLGRAFQLYDEVRIDHFRGFAGYWAVEAWRETAMIGTWKQGPGQDLFDALKAQLGSVPILAEDLGVITPDVDSLREAIEAPGMLVLQFAFGGSSKNFYLPHNHYENSFVYPGTHDNETTVGWWKDTASLALQEHVMDYFGLKGSAEEVDISWLLIQAAYRSVGKTAVVQMQDVLRLDNSARMNTPGKAVGNWGWRVGPSDVWENLKEEAEQLKLLVNLYDRTPQPLRLLPQAPERPQYMMGIDRTLTRKASMPLS